MQYSAGEFAGEKKGRTLEERMKWRQARKQRQKRAKGGGEMNTTVWRRQVAEEEGQETKGGRSSHQKASGRPREWYVPDESECQRDQREAG